MLSRIRRKASKCEDLYADNASTIMDDGIILYASQKAEDTVQLPPGVVAEVPAQTPFLFEVHYVNTSDEDVEVNSYVNAYTIWPEQVTNSIWGGPVRDRHINIPPMTDNHIEWTRCVMNADVEVVFMWVTGCFMKTETGRVHSSSISTRR